PVGRVSSNVVETPVNQRITPAGLQVELPGMRPQALALSPDSKVLAVAGLTHELVILEPASGSILQHVPLPAATTNGQVRDASSEPPDPKGELGFTGLIFSPDGSRLYLASASGDIKVFNVAGDGKVSGLFSLPLPPANAPRRAAEIPAGIDVSADGRRLYLALNL